MRGGWKRCGGRLESDPSPERERRVGRPVADARGSGGSRALAPPYRLRHNGRDDSVPHMPLSNARAPVAQLVEQRIYIPSPRGTPLIRGWLWVRVPPGAVETTERPQVAMAYDKAKWHFDGVFPKDLPRENGGTHIGIFLAWAVNQGMAGPELVADAAADLDAVRDRKMTGRGLLFRQVDGGLIDEDLNEEGNAFATHYYDSYIDEYARLVCERYPTMYHLEDIWLNYDWIAGMIDKRYDGWRAKYGGSAGG